MLTQTMINHGTSRRPVAISRPAAPVASHTGTIEMMGAPMPFARNAEIYGENEPAEYLYKVVTGAVRTYKVPTTAVVRSAPSICRATFSALKSATCTHSPPKRSLPARCW